MESMTIHFATLNNGACTSYGATLCGTRDAGDDVIHIPKPCALCPKEVSVNCPKCEEIARAIILYYGLDPDEMVGAADCFLSCPNCKHKVLALGPSGVCDECKVKLG